MIRVRIAAWLLRRAGVDVEYTVRRGGSKLIRGKGRMVLATRKIKEARSKLKGMRIAAGDAITITLAGVVEERHGEKLPEEYPDNGTY